MMFQLRFASALCAALICTTAFSQTFPDRPVTLLVPQSAGSGGDVVARLLSDKVGKRLGQSIVVENKPGANGLVAMSTVAKATPDGYTLLLSGVSQLSFNPHLYASLPYDSQKDFTYVAPVVDTPFVLVASVKSGLKTLDDLIAAAKKNPGHITFSSAGKGNSTHLSTEMVIDQASIELQHIPYNGSAPALNAVMSGEVDIMTSVLGTALPQIQSGKVVPLAVLAANRVLDLPDTPTLQEAGLNAPVMPGWYAIIGPVGLQPEIVEILNTAFQDTLAEADVRERLQSLYFIPMEGSANDMGERAHRDASIWGDFIKKAQLQVQ